MSTIGLIGSVPNDLGHEGRHPLLTKHELLQRLGHRQAGSELAYQIHPPWGVPYALLGADVRSQLLDAALDDEGLDLLVPVGVRVGGEILGLVLGGDGLQRGRCAVVRPTGLDASHGDDAREATSPSIGHLVEWKLGSER